MTYNGDSERAPYSGGDSMFTAGKQMREDFSSLYKVSFPVYERFYKEEKPDLVVCDFMANSCVDSAAKNSIPIIIGYQSLMFTYKSPYLVGTGALEPTTIENHTFLQRMKHAFYDPIAQILTALPVIDLLQEEKNNQGIPLTYSIPMLGHMGIGIANSYVGLENPRSIPSHIYPIGPILSEDASALPEDLQNFMNRHSKILYTAFGTMVKLPQDSIVKLLQHFQRAINGGVLDGIIWGLPNNDMRIFPKSYKVDNTEYSTAKIIEGVDEKIKILKWAPQQSILNHSSTKLFLSHGGLDSIYESMNAGVPMMFLPFVADQPRNAMLVSENGAGDYIKWGADSDAEIYQKFAKLLNPDNLELKSKVRQMQLITKFSSKRKEMAADLIETYAYSAKSCRQFSISKPYEAPCEVLPFLPLDKRISFIKSNLIDVYVTGASIVSVAIFSFIYLAYSILKRIFMVFSYKQKED